MSKNLWANPIVDGEEEITNKIELLLMGGGLIMRSEDGKLTGRLKAQAYNTPWIHVSHGGKRCCGIWNQIYTKQFGLIPHFCRFHCWKTVIKPPNVEALFQLEQLMMVLDCPSKCGIDVRNYTPGPYAGFVYGDSLADGRRYYQKFHAALTEMGAIEAGWKILLKRACTEQEVLKPSDQWDPMSPEDILLESKLNEIFVIEPDAPGGNQAHWHKNAIRRKWLRHALSIGDPTWQNVMEGVPDGFFPHVVQYQTHEDLLKTSSVEDPEKNLHQITLERSLKTQPAEDGKVLCKL